MIAPRPAPLAILSAILAAVPAAPAAAAPPSRPAAMEIDCAAPDRPISPWIYGIAYVPRLDEREGHQHRLGASARRWGGNSTSRFNPALGNAFNPGVDWFYRNVAYGSAANAWERFLDEDSRRGLSSALTIPTLGWVAKDDRSAGFPVSVFGPQKYEEQGRDAGNGVAKDGRRLPPDPARTSLPWSPAGAEAWVRAIRERETARSGRSVGLYLLDNEPMLWHETHRDVHPEPVGYDELLERLVAFGAAVRRADPGGRIAGPALWGWPAYFFSAKDKESGLFLRLDRRAHGDVPLLPWILRELRRHRERTGTRILDVVDVHFYPQGKGMGVGTAGATDPESSERRIRSTRALWDPTYRDESWIDDTVMLIPRLRAWIEEADPGLGIMIGEWSFGAERHPSGGLALAEALGRFGQQGVEAAFYWTYPADGSFAFHAFRAFRDFDGRGARFGERSLASKAPAGTSLFASRDPDGRRIVAVALNLDPAAAADATIALRGCGKPVSARTFVQGADLPGLAPRKAGAVGGTVLGESLPPWSITVVEILVVPAAGAKAP